MKFVGAPLILAALISGAIYFFYMGPRLPRGEVHQIGEMSSELESVPHDIEEVVGGLEVPWSVVFTSPTRILVAERPGRIRIVENGKLLEKPLHTFPEVVSQSEEGLMSLALHPEYAQNKFVYAVYAYRTERGFWDRVVRFREEGDRVLDMTTIFDGIPSAQYHAGSRIAFGPDGKLYITTGDATDKEIAQDLQSLGGKILRVNDDGTIPKDNPFPNSAIWSYGHRNPQGIAWRGVELYETEHGPSIVDGPPGGDEVNRIVKGGNYGWPLVSHEKTLPNTVSPLLVFTPAEAPASAMIYSGKVFPQFKNNLFFGGLIGEGLVRVVFNDSDPDAIVSYEKMSDVDFGRIRDVTESPDGYIYFTTSNRDGRGEPKPNDDRIFRIVPKGIQ